ncbi:hypothetical protein BCR42DRAFT_429927 [Absidia repens]|uniref:Chromatin modification-related protein n=1 Tax=Absidia repens TaxID=90262 RepID=A0A1X2HLD0_9FUNG|nr:hypothetical protein BCR42DRAFT_429927 [Absidia repens]
MNRSASDIFDDYLDRIEDLPSEIDQNMQELRSMDEQFQRFSRSPTTPSPTTTLTAAVNPLSTTMPLDLVEKGYKTAIEIQDAKIDKARRMYDLLSLRIEELDSQIAQNNISFIPMVDNGMQRCCFQQRSRHGHVNRYSSSSASSTYCHQMACSRSLTSMYTMAMDHPPLYHPRRTESDNKRSISSYDTNGSRKRTHRTARHKTPINTGVLLEPEIDPNEPKYCYCNQVSFGDMVACDGDNCEKEWFHYSCVGLTAPPVGKWFCEDCAAE